MTPHPTKDFGPIKSDYAFFEDHSTEADEDLAGYAAILQSTLAGRSKSSPVRMLDFGSGPGNFTARFLKLLACPEVPLSLELVEPVAVYREQAEKSLAAFTGQPVRAFAKLGSCPESHFDLILANHVFYYVPNLRGTLSELLAKLAPGGVFMTSIAGLDNTLIQFWQACFAMLGKPVPYNTSEDVQQVFAKLGVTASMQKTHYRLEFPDTTENRSSILRFLLADHFQELPRENILALFEPHVTSSGLVSMSIQHDQFWVAKSSDGQTHSLSQSVTQNGPDVEVL